MKNSDKPIHPLQDQGFPSNDSVIDSGTTIGLTKREHFALHLMQGLLSGADRHSQEGDCQTWNYEHLSKISISAADCLLHELEIVPAK